MDTQPLAQMLNGFIASWNRTRPATGGQFSALDRAAGSFLDRELDGVPRTDVTPLGAVPWLAAETRRMDGGAGVSESTIEKVKMGRYKTTELRIADPLVMAMDRPDALHDGTLTIRPNPLAPPDVRARCCGGSTT